MKETQLDNTKRTALKRRVAYSLAAGAAGVAVGTAATSADAAVVYSGPQNLGIALGGGPLDLFIDGDGFTDIKFTNYSYGGGSYQGAYVDGYPGKLASFKTGLRYVTALGGGFLVDASSAAPYFSASMAYPSHTDSQFKNATGKFVGFGFPIGGNDAAHIHYGWVRVDVNNAAGTFNVRDWAYEDVAGVGITTPVPEPATLGLLAAGAAGVATLRRRRAS